MPSNLSLRDLLAGARKRELIQLFQHRACQAMVAAMAGVILLLLLGTQILEWYWVALVAVIGLAVGIYRIRREIPSLYELAQRIDRKLRLADTLSTAFFFSENPDVGREAICQEQQHRAESTARDVDLRAAVPFRRSRLLLPAGGLALVAMGLFAVRYMVTGSMDLQPSLVSVAMDNFFGTKTEQAKNLKPDKGKFDPKKDADSPDNPTTENEKQPEDLLTGNDSQDPNQGPDNSKQTADAPPDKKESPDQTKNGDEQPDGKDSAPDDGKQQSNDKQDKSGNQNSKDSKQGTQSQSMMDKLKDAMQNLMDSMKSEDPQEAQNQKDGKQQQQKQKSDQQKGKQGDQSKSDSQADASADQQSQEGAQQQSDSKSSQKSQDKSSQQDAKNGAGSQDGDKLRRQAEELQAMGKISQILGQRSANITGEVTVEVGNSKQQLKTAWSQSQATHHDVGGEVPRDEVPLIYQEFVRQYFEEIHKPVPPVAKPPAKPAAQKGAGSPSAAGPAQ